MASLHVSNLGFEPAPNLALNIEESLRYRLNMCLPPSISKIIPKFTSESALHAPIHNVSFRARSGELTVLLSKSKAERKSIVELIANRRYSGIFEGDVCIDGGRNGSSFDDNIAYVHRKNILVPELTYYELLHYAARLRLKTFDSASIKARVLEVMQIMDLVSYRNRRVEDNITRGQLGGDLRRLSIACEIVSLPPVIVVEDPTMDLEPAFAHAIMTSLDVLSTRGHVVVCFMGHLSPLMYPLVKQVVVVSDGFSIYASSIANIEPYFCSQAMGYSKRRETLSVDFVLDVANGTERPVKARIPDSAFAMHMKFAASTYNLPSLRTKSEAPLLHGLPDVSYFHQKVSFLCGGNKINRNKSSFELTRALRSILFWFGRVYVAIERALYIKLSNARLLVAGAVSSMFIASLVGYLQYGNGEFGYDTMNLVGFPQPNAANITAVLFFVCAFTIAQQALNVHIICQSLQVFRYEQYSGVCPTLGFVLGAAAADIPPVAFNSALFATIVYFMTNLNYGIGNYFFFVETLVMNALIGLVTAYLLTVIIKKEIPVRDAYLSLTFTMIILSGFPFQLPFITSYIAEISQLNPMRWTFEALMNWKFDESYSDGYYYLVPFSMATFDDFEIFNVSSTFLFSSGFLAFALLLPWPYTLQRKILAPEDEQRQGSLDSDFGLNSGDVVRDSMVDGLQSRKSEGGITRRASETAFQQRISETGRGSDSINPHRPLLFNRETSITAKSALSINVSQTSIHNAMDADPKQKLLHGSTGPTVEFRRVSYTVRDAFSPLGVKNVLQDVSGKFDWGKLSMILGADSCGRSSLLRILAGDTGLRSEVTGEILFDGVSMPRNVPLWERCAFVESHDELIRDITVGDTILYAMKLRCPKRSLFNIAASNVAKTVSLLHLDDIVNKKTKYITRGERRRVSIAEEIVGGPNLLLIDEPITNLDSHDESVMMQCFRELVNQDRTVIAAMHHPSARVFHLFDTVLLLSKGRVIFYGEATDAVKYFTTLPNPYNIGQIANPADFLSDISGGILPTVAGDILTPPVLASYFQDEIVRRLQGTINFTTTNLSAATAAAVTPDNKMVDRLMPTFSPLNELSGFVDYSDRADSHDTIDRKNGFVSPASFVCPATLAATVAAIGNFFVELFTTDWETVGIQIEVIFVRSVYALWYRKKLILGSFLLHVLMACFLGWVLGPSGDQIYNLTSFFAISTLMIFFANLQTVYFIFTSHKVFLKEHSRGLYSTFLYWSYSQFPMYLLKAVCGVAFAVVSYYLLELNSDSESEGFFILCTLCTTIAGSMVAEWIIFLIRDIRSGYLSLPAIYFVFFAFSGLFLKASTLPTWMKPWTPSFSLIRWTMQADFINSFDGNTELFPVLPYIDTYSLFLILFGWGGKTKWYCLGMVVANIGAYKVLSLLSASYSAIYQKGGRGIRNAHEE